MSLNSQAPQFILVAVQRLYDTLPALVGADWPTIQPQVDAHIATLQKQPGDILASTQLFGLLARYEAARQRLSQELIVQQAVAANINQPLEQMQAAADETLLAAIMSGFTWDVDHETIPSPGDEASTRAITLKDGGVNGGHSIKFRNLDLNLGQMMSVGAGFLLAGQDMLDQPTPFMLAGGVLVMVGTLLGEMTVKIEQQEATVFWGCIVATNDRPDAREASTETIFATTNAERHKRGLTDLTDEQFKHSLYQLEQLGSIARVDGDTYRIVERFTVKG